jgi:lipoate synthase
VRAAIGSVEPGEFRRLPPWLKIQLPGQGEYTETKALLREKKLVTVCEEARCPNLGHCWARGTATIMILGELCTRRCGFCAGGARPAEWLRGLGRAAPRGRGRGRDEAAPHGDHVGRAR